MDVVVQGGEVLQQFCGGGEAAGRAAWGRDVT